MYQKSWNQNKKLTSAQHARLRLEAILRIDNSPKDHSQCKFSTGICESLTCGVGYPNGNGYFDVPCFVCLHEVNRRISVQAA